ncbi:MAG: deoxyribose-phosphate aldolase [Chloroflexota bacterium]
MLTVDEAAQMIDHSILLPGQSDQDLVAGIEIARKYHVKCVVPKAHQAARAKELLQGSAVRLCLPISFPQGFNLPEVKAYEAELVLQQGAVELDMVINTAALRSGDYEFVERDIRGVVAVANRYGAPVKAILETSVLTDAEKVAGAKLAERAGAKFVKTSTGSIPGGATVEDIRLLRATVGPDIVVKASGFIADVDKFLALYEAGARRFGTAFTEPILEGLKKKLAASG